MLVSNEKKKLNPVILQNRARGQWQTDMYGSYCFFRSRWLFSGSRRKGI